MPTIEIKRQHGVELAEAKVRIRGLVEEFLGEYPALVSGVDWAPDGSSAAATGKGFSARFDVDAKSLRAAIDLSMLLRPMKGRVEASLVRRLDKAFGPPA